MSSPPRLDQTHVDYSTVRHSAEVQLRVDMMRDRIDVLSIPNGSKVVEAGLGSGDTTRLLASRFDLTCVDLEQSVLEKVQSFIVPHKAEFICAPAEEVKLERGAYCNAFLIGLLEHCPDARAVLNNMIPSLAPGGRIHVLVNNANSIHRHLGLEMRKIESLTELSERDIEFGHHRVYTPEGLRADLEACGLAIDYFDLHYLKPLPTKYMDLLPIEVSRAFVELGRKFPELSGYIYAEARIR